MGMSEIDYFRAYLKGLDDFLYMESKDLTVKQYMRLVLEIISIREYIQLLNTTKNGTNIT